MEPFYITLQRVQETNTEIKKTIQNILNLYKHKNYNLNGYRFCK